MVCFGKEKFLKSALQRKAPKHHTTKEKGSCLFGREQQLQHYRPSMSGKEEVEEQPVPPGPRARKLQTVLETALQTYVGSITQQQFLEAFPHRNAQVDAILKEAFDTFKDDIIKNTRVRNT